jgi:adenylate cyclase
MDIHNKVIRAVIDKYELYEVKTVGDAFVIASSCPVRALRCAFEIELALYEAKWDAPEVDVLYKKWIAAEANSGSGNVTARGDNATDTSTRIAPSEVALRATGPSDQWNGLRVRIGLHFGDSEVTFDNTTKRYDYRGAAVAVAARVEAAAHGGQVMATQTMWHAAKAIDPTIVDGVAVMNIGETRLRGFRDPFQLVQLMPTALASRRFPPARLGSKRQAKRGSVAPINVDDKSPLTAIHVPSLGVYSDSDGIYSAADYRVGVSEDSEEEMYTV